MAARGARAVLRADAADRHTAFCGARAGGIGPFLQGLEALGYVDGKTVAIEYRDAAGKYERVPELADELVRLNPDVIFSFGGDLAPVIKKATATIPIVVVVSNDPVESGLVASLGRSGA
jgi:putative ABC transport system substrate-binding protein